MRRSESMSDDDGTLVRAIGDNNGASRECREAMTKLQVRSIAVQEQLGDISEGTGKAIEKTTSNPRVATWTLAVATIVLVIIPAIKH